MLLIPLMILIRLLCLLKSMIVENTGHHSYYNLS